MDKFVYTLCPAFLAPYDSYIYTNLWNEIDLNNSFKVS